MRLVVTDRLDVACRCARRCLDDLGRAQTRSREQLGVLGRGAVSTCSLLFTSMSAASGVACRIVQCCMEWGIIGAKRPAQGREGASAVKGLPDHPVIGQCAQQSPQGGVGSGALCHLLGREPSRVQRIGHAESGRHAHRLRQPAGGARLVELQERRPPCRGLDAGGGGSGSDAMIGGNPCLSRHAFQGGRRHIVQLASIVAGPMPNVKHRHWVLLRPSGAV